MNLLISYQKTLTFPHDLETTFCFLADIPLTSTFFPKLEELIDLGRNCYQWDLQPQGPAAYAVQTIYACRYRFKPNSQIAWEPIRDIGNSFFSGSWQLSPLANKCHANFNLKGELSLPVPAFAEVVAAPLIRSLFNSLLNDYLENLQSGLAKV
ncbi:MAG: hypothetical protein ACRBF0_08915 [Calditrichia bacterium]